MPTEAGYIAFLRELPQDWQTARISAVARVVGGGTPSRDVPGFWGGDIPWVTPGEVSREGFAYLSETRERITAAGLAGSGATLVPAGSLMVTTRATLGARVINSVPMTTNQGFKSLVFESGTDAPFYYYLTDKLKPELKRRATGTTFLEVSAAELARIEVPVPPGRERRLIAEILDTLDTTIRQTEAIIEKLKQVKQGLLHDLLTRGIDANGELRPPQSQAPHLYKVSALGWIPREWNVHPVGQISESMVDGPFGSNLKTEHYVPLPGVRVVRLQNIGVGDYDDNERAYVSDLKARSLSRNQVVGGDVLVAALGDERYPVGRACCYPADLPPAVNKADCFRLRPRAEFAIGAFVMRSLNGATARRQVRGFEQGVTMQRVNLGNLKRVLLSMPPVAEQQLICERLDVLEGTLAANLAEVSKLLEQKSGLMDDLLTGRVRVTPFLETAAA